MGGSSLPKEPSQPSSYRSRTPGSVSDEQMDKSGFDEANPILSGNPQSMEIQSNDIPSSDESSTAELSQNNEMPMEFSLDTRLTRRALERFLEAGSIDKCRRYLGVP